MSRQLLLAGGLIAAVWAGGIGARAGRAGEDPQEARVRELVARLGADDWDKRDEAEQELILLGTAGLKLLEAAARSDDAEVRERAARIVGQLRPLANLESPDRGVRIEAADEVNVTAEGLLAKGQAAAALSFYRRALEACPDLLDSAHVLKCVGQAGEKLSAEARAEFEKSDLGLFVARKHDQLRKDFPKSWLSGKTVYAKGDFEEYLRLFPSGFYAPPARYCLIAGHRTYALPEEGDRPVRVTDPDREIRAWPQFLKDHPDFEGADDANYRLARALEEKGRCVEACLRLRIRYPDGDLELNSLERLLFVMDARMGARELGELRAALEKDREKPERLLLTSSDLAGLALYVEALKLLRDGNYRKAGLAFAKVPKPPEDPAEGKDDQAGAEADDGDEEGDDGGDEGDEGDENDQIQVLDELVGLVTKRTEFAAKAAELAEKPDAGRLRDLARLMCSEDFQYVFMTGMEWASWLDVSSYDRAEGPAEFCQKRSRFWQAAQVCERLLRDHPKDPAAADAVYTLALCHCRMAETHWAEHRSAYWRDHQKENVRKSIDWYTRFARDHPDDARAEKARRAAETLTKNWFQRGPGAEEQP